MPTTRKMYTLLEIKEFIAKKEKCAIEEVMIMDCGELQLEHGMGTEEIKDATYIFYVDHL